jgi:hypothetical protein
MVRINQREQISRFERDYWHSMSVLTPIILGCLDQSQITGISLMLICIFAELVYHHIQWRTTTRNSIGCGIVQKSPQRQHRIQFVDAFEY